jgi:hypothetical protein
MRLPCVCLVCLAVLARGEQHGRTGQLEAGPHEVPADFVTLSSLLQGMSGLEEHHDHGPSDTDDRLGDHHGDHHHGKEGEGGPGQRHLQYDATSSIRDYRVWLAATGAILVISLCGIFGVIIIPIMQKIFYQHLIQFLIALAVGTLVGDALLHLLPHAVITKLGLGHDHGTHDSAVWLGLVAAAAMVGFFVFEKAVTVLGEWREGRREERKVRVVREGHVASDKAIGEVQCKSKYSTHCINDFHLDTLVADNRTAGNCEEQRELRPEPLLRPEERETDTVIISEHEVKLAFIHLLMIRWRTTGTATPTPTSTRPRATSPASPG